MAAGLVGLLGCMALALCSLVLCEYHFGVDDQAQYLVQVIAAEEPGAFGDDPYLAVFPALRSQFWHAIEWLTNESTRPAVCLVLAVAIAALNAWILMLLMGRLLGPASRRGPWTRMARTLVCLVPALVLVVPKERNWFGLVSLGDGDLTATFAVMPCVFGALLMWISRRPVLSLMLCLLAVPIQGQTGAYLLATWWMASFWTARGQRGALAGVLLIGVIGAVWLGSEAVTTMEPGLLALYEGIGRGLYAELIDPLAAPAVALAGSLMIVGLGVAATWGGSRAHRATPAATEAARQRLRIWWVASVAFPLIGVSLMVLDLEAPLLWRLMVSRSLMLPQIVALIALSLWCVEALRDGGVRAWAGGLVLVALVTWPFPQLAAPLAGAGLLALGLIVVLINDGVTLPRIDVHLGRSRLAPGLTVAALALLVITSMRLSDRAVPWLSSGAPESWLAAQHWARTHTPPGTQFVTPPYLSDWRVGSHRATYGEIKDGGLSFYQEQVAFDWARRMDHLGVEAPYRWFESIAIDQDIPDDSPALAEMRRSYARALDEHAEELRRDSKAQFIVMERAAPVDLGTEVWSNERFIIQRLEAAGEVGPRLAGDPGLSTDSRSTVTPVTHRRVSGGVAGRRAGAPSGSINP